MSNKLLLLLLLLVLAHESVMQRYCHAVDSEQDDRVDMVHLHGSCSRPAGTPGVVARVRIQ